MRDRLRGRLARADLGVADGNSDRLRRGGLWLASRQGTSLLISDVEARHGTVMDLEVSCNAGGWQARFGNLAWPCAVGCGGVRKEKSEGDGATPAGCWPIRRVLYRADRLIRPETVFPCDPVRPDDAWCDAPSDPQYNTLVRLPHPTSHERLWREEAIYDCIAVLGYNDSPVHAGAGSAIFLHIARRNLGPTEGCVALLQDHLLEFLRAAHRSSRVCVEPT